ncbi:secretion type II protein gspD [Paraburkholderia hospita]|uniref:Secretion protein n=1 Tax=Paraburkholderia hospita TaxID=169430 RepID=A0AAN1JIZ8_9BURK|nr:secretion protein [Paraburkholderia hospita]EIM94877.1 secretion type II protein gspD [Paraburkholderia hospita]OUL74866.1 secretion protein [Paraburkholderia hospita]OUL86775.1 secretion protein [Paraburkholderia hospita]SEH70713.1 general secretion pathway protein D [Paraburkholderia hospita]
MNATKGSEQLATPLATSFTRRGLCRFAARHARTLALLLAVPIVLTGCAAERAYRDGKDLVAQGKVDEGLAKLQQAVTQDPHDPHYRAAWLAERESAVARFDEEGDRLAAGGARAAARKSYQHALTIDPANERALSGIAALEGAARIDGLVERAEMLAAKDSDSARGLIAKVLTEAPAHPRALALQRKLNADTGFLRVEAALASAYRKPVRIDFKDAPLKQVFEVISRSAGLNFLFDKDVKTDQRTSIYLRNSTIEAAVRYVLATNQLAQQVLDENTVLIYPNTPAKLKDYQELAVRTFFLSNADAKTVANTLKTIVKSHDVVADEKLNVVIVRDTPDAIRMAEKLVALEDVPEPEVMLEVEVLEVQRNSMQDLGIAWPSSITFTPTAAGSAFGAISSGSGSSGSSYGSSSSGGSGSSPALSLHDLLNQTSRTVGVSSLQATVNANRQDSNAKLLTNPRIRVRNHEKAKILIGERVPNITSTATSTGFVSQSINYLDIGLTLNVEPTIYLDDTVGIKVALEVSSLLNQITGSSGTTAYEIGTRTASTVLQLKNGETDVLAGLIDSQERTSGNKIPGLGQMPVLGRLFGATTDDDKNTEIVLSITPHLVRNIRHPDASLAYFTSGTETNMQSMIKSNGIVTPAPSNGSSSNAQAADFGTSGQRGGSNTPQTGAYGAYGSSGAYGAGSNAYGAGAGAYLGGDTTPLVGGAGTPGTAEMSIQGPPQVKTGDSVTVALLMQADQPVTSASATVSYDVSKLQFTGVTEGDFLKQGGAQTSFSNRVAQGGQLILADSSPGGTGGSAQATFAVLSFKALAPAAQTSIQVQPGSVLGAGGQTVTMPPPSAYSLSVGAR